MSKKIDKKSIKNLHMRKKERKKERKNVRKK